MESIKEFNTDIFKLFDDHWALVTAGTPEDYNTMTISWGSLGTIWAPRGNGRQIATIYIKPSRYTFNYLEKSDYYTISFFPEEKRKDLAYLGSHSGRDEDKLAATSLTPVEKSHGTMGFAEAILTLVCHKLYSDGFKKENIPAEIVAAYYDGEEPHHFYIGEIVDFEEQ